MPEIDLSGAVWRKSTRSSGSGACIEVATFSSAAAVRDSKHSTGPTLIFALAEWVAFTAAIRHGKFD